MLRIKLKIVSYEIEMWEYVLRVVVCEISIIAAP